MVQLSHPHVITGKTIALIIWIFSGKVMSLLFNMLSSFVIALLPRSKYLLISLLQPLSAVILEPKILNPNYEVLAYTDVKWNLAVMSFSMLLLLLSHFSCVRLCATPYTAAYQAPLSLGFSRQEYWSALPFPSSMHENEN